MIYYLTGLPLCHLKKRDGPLVGSCHWSQSPVTFPSSESMTLSILKVENQEVCPLLYPTAFQREREKHVGMGRPLGCGRPRLVPNRPALRMLRNSEKFKGTKSEAHLFAAVCFRLLGSPILPRTPCVEPHGTGAPSSTV